MQYKPYALLAFVLSFLIPGLGHAYINFIILGSWKSPLAIRAYKFAGGYLLSSMLTPIIIGFPLMFIVWIWAMVDSVRVIKYHRG